MLHSEQKRSDWKPIYTGNPDALCSTRKNRNWCKRKGSYRKAHAAFSFAPSSILSLTISQPDRSIKQIELMRKHGISRNTETGLTEGKHCSVCNTEECQDQSQEEGQGSCDMNGGSGTFWSDRPGSGRPCSGAVLNEPGFHRECREWESWPEWYKSRPASWEEQDILHPRPLYW